MYITLNLWIEFLSYYKFFQHLYNPFWVTIVLAFKKQSLQFNRIIEKLGETNTALLEELSKVHIKVSDLNHLKKLFLYAHLLYSVFVFIYIHLLYSIQFIIFILLINSTLLVLLLLVSMALLKCTNFPLVICFLNFVQFFDL